MQQRCGVMLKEFFCASNTDNKYQLCTAWGAGLAILVGHAFVNGWIKYSVSEWYGEFYNLLEQAGGMQINTTTTQWMAAQHNVRLELFELCKISIVAVIVSPLSKYIRSVWALQWRMALIRSYLSVWNPNREPIEGASQRVHEDTYRFSRGIDMCFTTILDSIVTLFVFVPILTRLGAETPCPRSASVFSWMGSSWLIGMATTSALVGFIITMILGHRLVRLEVQNQVGEAHMRKDLVVLEMSPATICVAYPSKQYDADDADAVNSVALMPPLPHFIPISNTLKRNYSRLFLNFCSINLWLAIFDQANTILPYMVFGPLLFNTDQEHRIMLGTLVQVANSFDKVFGSLSIIAENWGSVNEFRSVALRLHQFEQNLYHNVPHPSRRHVSSSWRSCWWGFQSTGVSTTRAIFGEPIEMHNASTNADTTSASDVSARDVV